MLPSSCGSHLLATNFRVYAHRLIATGLCSSRHQRDALPPLDTKPQVALNE